MNDESEEGLNWSNASSKPDHLLALWTISLLNTLHVAAMPALIYNLGTTHVCGSGIVHFVGFPEPGDREGQLQVWTDLAGQWSAHAMELVHTNLGEMLVAEILVQDGSAKQSRLELVLNPYVFLVPESGLMMPSF